MDQTLYSDGVRTMRGRLRKIWWDDTKEDVKVFMFVEGEQVGNKYRRKINGTSSRVSAGK